MASIAPRHGSANPINTTSHQDALDQATKDREHIIDELAALPGLTDSVFVKIVAYLNGLDEGFLTMIRQNLHQFAVIGDQLAFNGNVLPPAFLLSTAMSSGPAALGGAMPAQPANLPVGGNQSNQLSADDQQALQAIQAWVQASGMPLPDFISMHTGYFNGMRGMNALERTNNQRLLGRLGRRELQFATGGTGTLEVENGAAAVTEVQDVIDALNAAANGNRAIFSNLRDTAVRLIRSNGSLISSAVHQKALDDLTAADKRIKALVAFIRLLAGRRVSVKLSNGLGHSTSDAVVIPINGVSAATNMSHEDIERLADPEHKITAAP